MNRYCIIMAGGVGTRFWPLSRQNKPKQFLDIMGTGKSFLRHTFERFAPLVPDENFIVVTNRRYKELIRNILPEIRKEQILCEPIGRNTAPAIAYAAYWLRKHDPEAQMIVTPADHWVVDEEGFRSIIGECLDFVTGHDALMTVGIRPTRPETGYGYIQASADETICPVKSFTEKPNLELAQTFVQCGEFFWNSGIFVWKVRDIVRAFAQYLPEHHALFSSVEADHWVVDEEGFRSIIGECLDFVTGHDALMTVGIRPTRPETGYGYIQASADETICPVKSFTEKPNLELAQTFVQCGEFFWNSGIFVWKVRDIVRAFAQYLPEHHALFSSVEAAFGTPQEDEAVERVFSCSHPISIDYGVMEKAGNVYVRSNADVGWSDVGTWGSLYQLSRKDRYANAKPAEGCYAYDTRNCIISLPAGKVAVVSGLKEYIVVDTEDVLMICPRGEEQNIKKYIDEVKFNKGEEYI